MLVRLPSNGVLGFKSVNAVQPKYKDLLKLVDSDSFDPILKSEFVQLFIDFDVKKLSICDRDYLYMIGLSSICPNDLQFSYKHCNKTFNVPYDLSQQDVHTLKGGMVQKVMDGKLELRVPIVDDEYFAYKFVTEECDEFNKSLFDSVVALRCVQTDKLDFSSVKRLEETADELLDMKGWFAVYSFKHICFHGIEKKVKVKCPECGKEFTLTLDFPASVCNFGSEDIMNRYRSVMRLGISYNDFLNMTVSEHLLLLNAENTEE